MNDPEHICTIMERVLCNLVELQEEADGWRRRNLIFDSQIQSLGHLVVRMDALAQVYEDVLKRLPEAPWLEQKLTHLLTAILKEDKQLAKAVDDDGQTDLGEVFR